MIKKIQVFKLAFILVFFFYNSFLFAHENELCKNIFEPKQLLVEQIDVNTNPINFNEPNALGNTDFYKLQLNKQVIFPLKEWYQSPFKRKAVLFLKKTIDSANRFLGSNLSFFINFVNPTPLNISTRKDRIALNQLFNPNYQLTKEDYKTLKGSDIEKINLNGQILKRHPKITFFRQVVTVIKASTLSLFIGLSLSQAHQMEKNTMTYQEYLNQAEVTKNLNVQLLLDTSPLPHTSIKIGNRVYSFNGSELFSYTLKEYFKLDMQKKNKNSEDKFNYLKDGALANSFRAIDIILTQEEIIKLKNNLELETGKNYRHKNGVNDCATMVARFLNKSSNLYTPPIIDSFPTVMGAYLNLMHLFGDKRVGETSLVIFDDTFKKTHLLRNTWAAILETKLLLLALPIAIFERADLAMTFNEDQLSNYQPDMEKLVESWKLKTQIKIENEIQSFTLSQKSKLEDLTLAQLNFLLKGFIEPKLKETNSIINHPKSEFYDLIINQEMSAQLIEKQHEILKLIELKQSVKR